MSWHLGRMAPFDLETTDKDPENARIVQAYLARVGAQQTGEVCFDGIVDPGIEVPAESTKFHGLTTDDVRARGEKAPVAVDEIAAAAAATLATGVPLVGHNIRYDLTVVDRECRRHGLPTLEARLGGAIAPVIDTFILSKHVDQYRRRVSDEQGAQVLKTCAEAFAVEWDDEQAHGARYDAMAAVRVAWRIGQIAAVPQEARPRRQGRLLPRFGDVAVPLARLHERQMQWAAEQDASSQRYWLDQARAAKDVDDQIEFGRRAESCTGHWPLYPYEAERQEQLG